ncbi:MAG: 30S ribosomal protein S18 [Endomicrobiia bacterium]
MQNYRTDGQRETRNYSSSSGRRPTFGQRRKRVCYFCSKGVEPDYKNVVQLKNYISDKGKILPSKVTKTCTKHQRRVAKAIKRSRMVALLSFVDKYRE